MRNRDTLIAIMMAIEDLAEKRAKKTGKKEQEVYEILGELQEALDCPLPPRWRTKEEVFDAEAKFFHLVWWNRHNCYKQRMNDGLEPRCDPKVWKQALAAAKRIEEKYRDEPLGWDDFDWGMINGKFSTLRWISGEEWDFLDT